MIDFDQYVEYVDVDGVHPVALEQHTLDAPLTLDALSRGYIHVAALGRTPTLDVSDLDVLHTDAATVYSTDVIAHEMVSDNPAVIVDRLTWVQEHPLWRYGATFVLGEVCLYAGNLWRCVQAHTAQADPNYAPDVAASLWTRYYAPTETPAWVQPVGASDAWPLGAQVTHNGHLWTSLIVDNVWEPGSIGAESLWRCEDCEPPTNEWAVGVAYVGDNTAGAGHGDVVLYVPNGHLYRCLQSHTSIATWTPPAVPALWLDVGVA